MRRKTCFFVGAFSVAVFFLICQARPVSAIELNREEQKYIREKGAIVFVSQTKYPPFEFIDENGEHVGMCIELARWMATELGFTARFTDTTFKNAKELVISGGADVITSLFYSEKRDEAYDFTKVMFEVPASIFVLAKRPDIKDMMDLNGKIIAMQEGDYAKEFLERNKIEFEVIYTKDFAEATDLVIEGKADAIIGDEQIVLYHLFKSRMVESIKKVGEPLYIGQNCMATREGNILVRNIIDKGIEQARDSGVLDKINRKWLGIHYTLQEPFLSKYLIHIFAAIGAVFLLALASWYWTIRLKHAVNRRTEDLIKEQEYSRRIIQGSPDVICGFWPEGKTTFINPAGEHITGWTAEELIGNNCWKLFFPEYDDERIDRLLKGFAEGEIAYYETELKNRNGELKTILWNSIRRLDGKGNVIEVICFGNDITNRKKMEEALRASEEKFKCLGENAPDIIFTLGLDGTFTYVNPAWERILGHKSDEVVGKYFIAFTKKEYAKEYIKIFKAIRDGKETLRDMDIVLRHSDGTERLFDSTGAPNINSRGEVTGMVGLCKDITGQRELEAQLQTAQRMEAIGTLAGGIAHDFNNLLMGIQGHTSLVLYNTDPSSPDIRHLKGIEEYIRRAADLNRQLLGFARGGKYDVKAVDLNMIVEETSEMFGRTKKEISISLEYEKDIWTVEVDRGQIEQVLLNIYVNAWQAMPAGGNLRIRCENVIVDHELARLHELDPGKYVMISIEDTGVGMDEKTQKKIFDPFFTTKELGRGTGLGLASAYGIIKNHYGFIEVDSEVGHGTTFRIYLPASKKELEEKIQQPEEVPKGDGTLLFVDDEDIVIDVGKEMIRAFGYRVITAKSGEEALKAYMENRDRIDIVILDMVMPGMGGGEVYDRLKVINPGVKVILSSGYSINGQAREILERGCDGFIQKPFNMEQLSRKIREILYD